MLCTLWGALNFVLTLAPCGVGSVPLHGETEVQRTWAPGDPQLLSGSAGARTRVLSVLTCMSEYVFI